MARLIREHDWAATPLGPIEKWSDYVRAMVDLVLATPHVSALTCGPERILIYNDAAASLYGSQHPTALGKPLAEAFPGSYPAVRTLYDRAFAGETIHVEAQPLNLEGGQLFDATLCPVRKADGQVAAVHMVGFEVTQRMAAERALRESEERYRAFVIASADVVYRMSSDWSEMRELDGRGFLADTSEPTVGWMEHYIHPADRETVRAAIAKAIQAKTMFELEHRVIGASGELLWTHSRAVPVRDERGEIKEWLGAARDVTEKHRAEEALRESEAVRRVALEGGRMGSWRWDLTRRQVWGDEQFLSLWGLPPSDAAIPLERFTERQAPEGIVQTEEVVARAVRAKDEFDSPIEIVSGPTAGRWLRWRGRPSEGDTSVLYGVSFDITEQKRAELALRESEERQAFLLHFSDTLRPLVDAADVEREATRLLGEHLRADRCFLSPVYNDGTGMCVREEYLRDDASSVLGDYTFAQFGDFVGPELHAGHILAVEDVSALTGLSADERQSYADTEIGAYLLIPLVRDNQLAAFLTINHRTPRKWSDADKAVALQTADRLWADRERAQAEAALRESERLQSTMLSVIPVGLALCDTDGKTVISNPEWERFVPTGTVPSQDSERVSRWRSWDATGDRVVPSDYPVARALRGEAVEPAMEFLFEDDDGKEFWTSVAALPLSDDGGDVVGAVSIIQDIDVTKRSVEALRQTKERQAFILKLSDALRPMPDAVEIQNTAMRYLAEYLGVARAGYYRVADDQDSFVLKARWERDTPALPEKLKMSDFGANVRDGYRAGRTLVSRDIEQESPSTAGKTMYRTIEARARIGVPLVKEGKLLTVVAVHSTEPRDWTPAEIQLVEDVAERTWEAVERARAETALRESERHQRLLLAELQHRVRNTLAVVRSIARRTADNSLRVEDMLAHFQGRLDAFSRVQAALTRSPDARIDLEMLIEDELIAHAAKGGEQVKIKGPAVALGPRAAERLSLAIHELTTNAVKHGALVNGHGQIRVSWTKQRNGNGAELVLCWKELGVEIAEADLNREGFGMELLKRSLPYDLQAETEVAFEPTGLRFELRMQLPEAAAN